MFCVRMQSGVRTQASLNSQPSRRPTVGGWGDGKLAAKGELMASYDVAAELEALLETVEEINAPPPVAPAAQRHSHIVMQQDDDLMVDDIEDLDLELDTGGKEIHTELQAQLAAFNEQYATSSDSES